MLRPRRAIDRFLAHPSSMMYATSVIISVTAATVLVGALVIRVFDASEFPSYGEAIWFTLQTATTVGYGDITPERTIGRVVAAVVMLVSIGLLTMVTAMVTSYFIQNASRLRNQSDHDELTTTLARLEASVTTLSEQLDELKDVVSRSERDVGR